MLDYIFKKTKQQQQQDFRNHHWGKTFETNLEITEQDIITCTSQIAQWWMPGDPKRDPYCSRKAHPPWTWSARPADPAVSGRWTGSLSAWSTQSPAAPNPPAGFHSDCWCSPLPKIQTHAHTQRKYVRLNTSDPYFFLSPESNRKITMIWLVIDQNDEFWRIFCLTDYCVINVKRFWAIATCASALTYGAAALRRPEFKSQLEVLSWSNSPLSSPMISCLSTYCPI